MAEGRPQTRIVVVVVFEADFQVLTCDPHTTMAQVRRQWQEASGRASSVCFMHAERYLPEDLTIAQALTNPSSVSLELRAVHKSKFWIQVYGRESTNTLFEVVATLTPAAVRRDIGRAVEIYTDDFILTYDGDELDQELPFNEQGLEEGAQLMVDLRVIVKVGFPENNETKTLECRCSDSVDDLRQRLGLDDDTALVSTSPYRRVLENSLHVCHIVSELLDLEIPIHLIIERKVMLTFEPITLEHLRQKMPVPLSCTPLDIYDLVTERFQLTTEFRLAIMGQALDYSKPLIDQLIDIDDVIQIDIIRPFLISDMWKGLLDEDSFEEVYLYSSESSNGLYLRDEINDQRLFYDDINFLLLGSVVDVFGAVSGKEKHKILVDRDVQRDFRTLTFDGVVQKLGWARNLLIDVVPRTGGLLPNEIMRNGHLLPSKSTLTNLHLTEDTLMITDPEKVFISSDKKLRIYRFAHGATYGDVRERMQQLKGCLDIGLKTRDWEIPNEAKNRKVDRELLFLTSESRLQTRLTVTINNQWYGCWFEPQQVSFTDVMINVGKQAEVMPRHLFSKKLYCCGCGRQLSKEEESHQAIPATCCKVKSLQLTDRRVKDVGIQTAGSRRRDVETNTSNTHPEAKGAASVAVPSPSVGVLARYLEDRFEKKMEGKRRGDEMKEEVKEGAARVALPSISIHVWARSPEDKYEKKTVVVEGSNCRALLTAADRQLSSFSLGESPVIFSLETTYMRDGKETRAVYCFDKKTENYHFTDVQDGGIANHGSRLRSSLRFFDHISPLPSSPFLMPLVVIRAEVEFLTITPKKQQLQVVPVSFLNDPSFVVLVACVRSGTQFFGELVGGLLQYVGAESDRKFSMRQIPGGPKHQAFALLRDKDPVPHVKVPKDELLCVYRREGLEPRVEKGCVRCVVPPQLPDIHLWSIPRRKDDFLEKFAAAARK